MNHPLGGGRAMKRAFLIVIPLCLLDSDSSKTAQRGKALFSTQIGRTVGAAHSLAAHHNTIQSSHERCQMFGLQPHQAPDLRRIEGQRLHELQQRNARLCAQALPLMEMLYEQLSHSQSMVLLTDASGVVLHSLGDPGFLARAQQIALAPGAQWAEATQGTNAVGTTLMTEKPTLVNGAEHYLRSLQFLTCSAAPIFDHKGALLGVIDVSGDRRSYHPHTLALARISARMIESQWFNDKFSQALRLHIHNSPQGLGTLSEGVLALNADGQLLGASRRALDLLGLSPASLRRVDLDQLFNTSLEPLVEAVRRSPEQTLALALRAAPDPLSRPGASPLIYARLSLGQGAQSRVGELAESGAAGTSAAQVPLTVGHAVGQGAFAGAPELLARTAAPLPPSPRPASYELGHFLSPPYPGASRLGGALAQSMAVAPAHEPRPGPAAPDSITLRQSEMLTIHAAVQACQGNLALAARQLGIGRSTLYRKLKAANGMTQPLEG